jgi:hypothetical protein
MNKLYKKALAFTIVLIVSLQWGCKKFVETDVPIDSITTASAFDSEAKILSAVRSMYFNMVRSTNYGFGGAMSVGPGVSSDELQSNSPTLAYYEFSTNTITPKNTGLDYYWGALYNTIYLANLSIINIPNSEAITEAAKKQYVAEAKFIRAACYFYLTNLFGELPLAVSTDYRVNAVLTKSPMAEVYDLIIADLRDAEQNLSETYPGATTSFPRIRANRFAAKALLSRVFLYQENWADAEALTTEVINAKGAGGANLYGIENNLANTFLLASKEVILHLVQGGTSLGTWDAWAFVPAATNTIPAFTFTDGFLSNFPTVAPLDLRRTSWIASNTVGSGATAKIYYYPAKYKIRSGTGTTKTEALAFLRLAEVYLTRAEARAKLNKISMAIEDLDVVRKRAGLAVATPPATTQPAMLTLIARERNLELFAELGHRWFDLKRRGEADDQLKNKPNWRPEAKLFPLPSDEIRNNRRLKQNNGYPD